MEYSSGGSPKGGLYGIPAKSLLTKVNSINIYDEEGRCQENAWNGDRNSLMIFPSAKKLSRGISRASENVPIISQMRNELCIALAEVDESTANSLQQYGLETSDCTFTLPDLSTQSGESGLTGTLVRDTRSLASPSAYFFMPSGG